MRPFSLAVAIAPIVSEQIKYVELKQGNLLIKPFFNFSFASSSSQPLKESP